MSYGKLLVIFYRYPVFDFFSPKLRLNYRIPLISSKTRKNSVFHRYPNLPHIYFDHICISQLVSLGSRGESGPRDNTITNNYSIVHLMTCSAPPTLLLMNSWACTKHMKSIFTSLPSSPHPSFSKSPACFRSV